MAIYLINFIELSNIQKKNKIQYLNQILKYAMTGSMPSKIRDVDLAKYHKEIILCGNLAGEGIVLEIVPFKNIKVWNGAKAKQFRNFSLMKYGQF